jgi:hypothetical protein
VRQIDLLRLIARVQSNAASAKSKGLGVVITQKDAQTIIAELRGYLQLQARIEKEVRNGA